MQEFRDFRGDPVELREIGLAIRNWRRSNGMSQRQLGRRILMSQSTLSRLENGLAPSVRLSRLAKLLRLMGFGRSA